MIINLFVLISFIIQIPVYAASSPSDWAQTDINEVSSMSLIPQSMKDKSYLEPITRIEFCHLVSNLYKKISTKELPAATFTFNDTRDAIVCSAAEAGIINGYTDGCFYPDNPINRQELAAILCRAITLCGINTNKLSKEDIEKLSSFEDGYEVASWASDSVAFCLANDIIKGVSDTKLDIYSTTSREQALVMINRCLKNLFDITPEAQNPYDLLSCDVSSKDISFVSFSNRALTIEWEMVSDAVGYNVELYLSDSNFWYADEDTFVKLYKTYLPYVTLKNLRAGKDYRIVVDAVDEIGNVLKSFEAYAYPHKMYTRQEKEKQIFESGEINTKEDADAQMQDISVNIWTIDRNGNKHPSKMTLTVHKNIAHLVSLVFDEIYNGEEKFPFKDVGAYSWRDSISHHNYGTAIDLNYNENYCLYKNGSYVGEFWKPYENVYSFPPDGEVVSIFAKYGFVWGGDEWSNPKDYMHFTYLEL